MIFKLLVVSVFLSSCSDSHFSSRTEYLKMVIGEDFRQYVERGHTFVGERYISRKNKPTLLKKFRFIEEVNKTLPNGNKIYRYANPYNDCKSTFIVNPQGIVIEAFGEGEDCDVPL